MKNLIKIRIKYSFSLQTVAAGLIFALFVYADFFIRRQFFTMTAPSLSLFFNSVPYICIVFIPFLCSKNSLALYDDFIPLGGFKKILVRFFVLLIFFAFSLCLLIFPLIFINLFFALDAGQVILSFLFLLFYASCLISLCLFLCELTSNQFFSFLISAVILALCNNAHNFALYFPNAGFLSSFFKAVSFAWHFDAASKGIFDSRDFVFFLAFTLIFLYGTFLAGEIKKGRSFTFQGKIRLFLEFFILFFCFLNSTRCYFRLDFSKDKNYSLSAYSKALLKELDQDLNITFYRSKTLSRLYPQIRDVSDFLNVFAMRSKKISYSIKNPDGNDRILNLLSGYGIKSQQIKNSSGTSVSMTDVYSAIVLEYGGAFEVLPFVIGSESLEYELDVHLLSLLGGKSFCVNVILGNGMNYSEDYSYLVPLFTSQGLECNPLFPSSSDFYSRLENARGPLLVIGDSQLGIEAAIAIENYILSGRGNAFFAISPYSVDIEGDWHISENSRTNVVEMLENWGVRFESQIAGDLSCSKITLVSGEENQAYENSYSQVLNYPLWIRLLPQTNAKTGLTLFWPSLLSLSDENLARPLLFSSEAAFSYQVNNLDTNPFSLSQNPFPSQGRGRKILGAEISGKLEGLFTGLSYEGARLVLIPDQYFLNSLMQNYSAADFSNFDFTVSSLLSLMNENELASLYEAHLTSANFMKISDEESFKNLANLSLWVLFLFIPLAVIILSLVYSAFQKKKRSLFCKDFK